MDNEICQTGFICLLYVLRKKKHRKYGAFVTRKVEIGTIPPVILRRVLFEQSVIPTDMSKLIRHVILLGLLLVEVSAKTCYKCDDSGYSCDYETGTCHMNAFGYIKNGWWAVIILIGLCYRPIASLFCPDQLRKDWDRKRHTVTFLLREQNYGFELDQRERAENRKRGWGWRR